MQAKLIVVALLSSTGCSLAFRDPIPLRGLINATNASVVLVAAAPASGPAPGPSGPSPAPGPVASPAGSPAGAPIMVPGSADHITRIMQAKADIEWRKDQAVHADGKVAVNRADRAMHSADKQYMGAAGTVAKSQGFPNARAEAKAEHAIHDADHAVAHKEVQISKAKAEAAEERVKEAQKRLKDLHDNRYPRDWKPKGHYFAKEVEKAGLYLGPSPGPFPGPAPGPSPGPAPGGPAVAPDGLKAPAPAPAA